MTSNGHNPDDPESLVNYLDATMEAVNTRCPFCNVAVEVIPASSTRFVLGITHDRTCPEWVED